MTPELMRHLCTRPGMYGCFRPYFRSVCAFLGGWDLARDGGPLAGFREWLIVRLNGGNNLTWEGLAMDAVGVSEDMSEAEERACLVRLADLFDEFSAHRQSAGLTQIHFDYGRWLARQTWYSGPFKPTRKRRG